MTGVLDSIGVLDRELDLFAEIAARESGAQMALIRFYDRPVGSGSFGLEASTLAAVLMREEGQVLELHDGLLSSVDAQHERRFFDDPCVSGSLHARFYARQPLVALDGSVVGTLCVFDRSTRNASSDQLLALAPIARAIMALTSAQKNSSQEQLALACASCVGLCTSGIAVFAGTDDVLDLIHPLFVNDALAHITGYSRDELLAGGLLQLVGEKTNTQKFSTMSARLRYEWLIIEVVSLYRKDGTRFTGEVRGERDRDVSGNVIHNMIIRDISLFHDAQQRLHLLSQGVDEADDFFLLATMDPENARIEYVNQSLCGNIGRQKHEIEHSSLLNLFSSENSPDLLGRIRTNIANREPVFHEVKMQRADGSTFWVDIVARLITDDDGFDHWLAVGRDSTLRRQTHEQLSELVAALDDVSESVVLYGFDEHDIPMIIYENQASYDGSFYPLSQMYSQRTAQAKLMRDGLARGFRMLRWIVRDDADARVRWIEVCARGIADTTGGTKRLLTHHRQCTPGFSESWLARLAQDLYVDSGASLETWTGNVCALCTEEQTFVVELPGSQSLWLVISWTRRLLHEDVARLRGLVRTRMEQR